MKLVDALGNRHDLRMWTKSILRRRIRPNGQLGQARLKVVVPAIAGILCVALIAGVAGSSIYFRSRINTVSSELTTLSIHIEQVSTRLTALGFEAVFDSEIPRNVSEISRASSPEELLAMRDLLASRLWGDGGMPRGYADLQVTKRNEPTPFRQDVAYDLTYPLGDLGSSHMALVEADPLATCLFAYHSGHGEGLFNQTQEDAVALMRLALNLGCDVLHASMPLEGDNADRGVQAKVPDGISPHDWMAGELATGASDPLHLFVNPIITALNWARAQKPYSKVIISGRSGGGWTAGLVAALDTDITNTIVINGSMPMVVRGQREADAGDWEQTALYDTLGYGDLYLLSAFETGRQALYTWNKFDSCCFAGARARVFFPLLQQRSAEWGIEGLRYRVDEQRDIRHGISSSVLGAVARILMGFDEQRKLPAQG